MTLKELKQNVKLQTVGAFIETQEVTIKYKRKKYTSIVHNRDAYLAILYKAKPNSAEAKVFRHTEKTGYEAFYNECKKKNHLR